MDQPVQDWLRLHPNSWHRQSWLNGFRQLGKAYVVIWLLLLWSCLVDRWRITITTLVALLLVCLSVCPIKALVRRQRPYKLAAVSAPMPKEDEGRFQSARLSFPSGDTAAAFAAATVLASSLRRRWAPALFAGAAVIGVLRITAMAHYPSDVSAGMSIGLLAGLAGAAIVKHQPDWWSLTVPRRWRMAGVALLLVLPALNSVFPIDSLLIFLRVYSVPVALLMVTYAVVRMMLLK